jgi:hypothetical protein
VELIVGSAERERLRRAAARDERLDLAGLAPGGRILPGVSEPFAAVSDQRLLLGRQGGFRFRPKEELLTVERPMLRVLWWDEPQPGPDKRYLIVQVSDGRWWDASCAVHETWNSNGFITALGENAIEVRD